tara:strand:- start:10252 stop:11097 length:846 start_codon:yes stop_codon:yes gene_type:complete
MSLRGWSFFICLVTLAACSADEEAAAPPMEAASRASRIISLDYCADQYVLALADRDNILALSTESQDDFSYLKDEAAGIPQVLPRAESVLALKPDLIVRSFGGGPQATALFERAGIPVLQIGWASDLDGLKTVLTDVAAGMGEAEKGRILAREFDERLASIQQRPEPQTALYMTPGGVTSGTGSLIDQMFSAAGLTNFETTPGWHDLPLERLLTEHPDVVAAAFYDSIHKTPGNWSSSRHPIALSQLENAETVPLNGAWTACGSWYLIEAIEALSETGGQK